MGSCAGADGRLYCAPHGASTVLVIVPATRSLSFIEGAGEGGMKYVGICAGADGRLYCAPWNASTVLVIEPWTRTLIFIEGAGETGEKYLGMCAAPPGATAMRKVSAGKCTTAARGRAAPARAWGRPSRPEARERAGHLQRIDARTY